VQLAQTIDGNLLVNSYFECQLRLELAHHSNTLEFIGLHANGVRMQNLVTNRRKNTVLNDSIRNNLNV
jgi:hypothetical protein